MRIAMLTNNYKPYIGGVPVSIEHLAKELRKLGHTVYIFAPSYSNQKEEPFVIRYPSFPVKIAGAPIPNMFTKLFYHKIKELQIDLIHVHHPAIVGNVALRLRRLLGIPVVFTYHTQYEEYLYYVKPLQQFENCTGILSHYLKRFCNCCDMVIAPTQSIKEHLLFNKNIQIPIRILPTGIPSDNFLPDQQTVSQLRTQFGENVDYLFGTVARLAKEKNLDFLLECLQKIKKQLEFNQKTFRYLLIGEGLEQKHLEEKVSALGLQNEVVFVGTVKNKDIKNYLSACDLFLFSSKSETQGIVLLEAMAAGTPVIAVDATGVRDIVKTKENGILTSEQPEHLAQEVMQVLGDTTFYKSLCHGARKTAAAYAEEQIALSAEHYYMELLNFCHNSYIHAILKLN